MNRSERLNAIMNCWRSPNSSIRRHHRPTNISPATARRDLDSLAAQRLLTRIRGGAAKGTVAYDLAERYNRDDDAVEKQLIAQAANSLIPEGAVIGLCGGTTSTAIAQVLSTGPI